MKTLLCTLILATLGAATAARADIVVTFDQTTQSALPGATLQFFGNITNDGATTVFLNSDDLNLSGLSFTTNDLFFANAPISLAAGTSSGDIELFDVTLSNPLLDAPGVYSGSYNLFGGADGNAQDNLGSTAFSVGTVPEPASFCLLLSGALAAWAPISRRLRNQA
jgi:hypothetical protein